jgi:hypothetical protein
VANSAAPLLLPLLQAAVAVLAVLAGCLQPHLATAVATAIALSSRQPGSDISALSIGYLCSSRRSSSSSSSRRTMLGRRLSLRCVWVMLWRCYGGTRDGWLPFAVEWSRLPG